MNMTASDNKNEARRGLFIKSKKLMLDQGEILYIESRAKKVEIHTVGALESIEIYATMEEPVPSRLPREHGVYHGIRQGQCNPHKRRPGLCGEEKIQ